MSITADLAELAPATSYASTNDYAQLKRQIKNAGLLEKHPGLYMVRILLVVGALLLSIATLVFVHILWIQIINAVFMAIVLAQIAYIGHDVGHRQVFAVTWRNDLTGLLLGNLLIGMSNDWWMGKHNAHHSHPNELDMDPDLNIPGICFNLTEARQKHGFARMVLHQQVWWFFPMLTLVSIDLSRASFEYLIKNWKQANQRIAEITLLTAHWILLPVLLISCLGLGNALLFWRSARAC